ncbi:UDP-galactose-lipid carrier transferase [Dehalogenimonas sp. WBC-2]|nr:UDP-galactose-lipid carrier transferase [Dehalogenimonas sp. WBC-2]
MSIYLKRLIKTGTIEMKYSQMFRVKPGSTVKLSDVDSDFTTDDKEFAEDKVKEYTKDLRDMQYRLYAEDKRSVLICLQGMDAAGKDGTIKHVLGTMNLLGTRVCGFKVPSLEEAAHDFLWRIEKQVPARGEVVIFNRSHYEDVLVVRVHKSVPKEIWQGRYALINGFEKNLTANNTHILKFFLHISPDEQLKRYRQRLDDPTRQWKISEADYTERAYWKEYQQAYEDALSKTSTARAPWYIIPSDHKWFRNLAVSEIVLETFKALGMKYPEPQLDIEEIRRRYHQAEDDGLI